MNARALTVADDRDLLVAIKRRNAPAFEVIYRRYAVPVHAIVYRILGDAAMTDEVTQIAFVRLWERADGINPDRLNMRAWLIAVAHRAAIDQLRRRRPSAPLDEVMDNVSPDQTDAPALEAERRSTVRSALDALPHEQKVAIELAYFGGLTQAEIAGILNEPLGTVKGRIRLAMQKLRNALGPYEERFA
jgi:RNA polymerase sigma-70 factor, ECF subfamily